MRRFRDNGMKIAVGRYPSVEVQQIRQLFHEIEIVQSKKRLLKRSLGGAKPGVSSRRFLSIRETLQRVGESISNAFVQISGVAYLDKIAFSISEDSDISLRAVVHLKNGHTVDPKQIFSEANLDLLSLLIFLALSDEASIRGQATVLVLDDVLQSVDSSIRLEAASYIISHFSDWQLIFTAHDRLWYKQLWHLFQAFHRDVLTFELVAWEFDKGPTIIQQAPGTVDELNRAIRLGDVQVISSKTGVLLEELSQRLSYTLPIKIERKKDDEYTLGELWPRISSILARTSLSTVTHDIDRLNHLRNLGGAHFNEWSASIELTDAIKFAEVVIKLHDAIKCSNCNRWIERLIDGAYSCRCGNVSILKH